MSTAKAAMPASPPEHVLTSPPDIDSAFPGSAKPSPFLSHALPPNFNLHLEHPNAPTGSAAAVSAAAENAAANCKTPRASRVAAYIPSDDDQVSALPTFSSPGRRGRIYTSIHQELEGPTQGTGDNAQGAAVPQATPKAGRGMIGVGVGASMGPLMMMGMSMSQSADPTPMRSGLFSSPVMNSPLRGVHVPGDDYTPHRIATSPIQGFTEPTPVQSPVSRGIKRGLDGLGQSPLRTAKRGRHATMSSTMGAMPASPLRTRSREVSTGSLMTHAPLERSASFAAPTTSYAAGTNRMVSNISTMSTTSTELMSPALQPQYSPYQPTMMGFPSQGQEMVHTLSYTETPNPGMASGTIAPSQLMPGGVPLAQITGSSVYTSPDMMNETPHLGGHMSTQTSHHNSPVFSTVPSAHSATFGSHHDHRAGTLSTIHEGPSDLVTPMSMAASQFTPGMGYSVGMPSHPTLPNHPGYHGYQSFTEAGDNTGSQDPSNVSSWSQNTYSANPSQGGHATWWSSGSGQYHTGMPVQPMSHHPSMPRTNSASYAFDQAPPSYHHMQPGMMPRSVSAPFVPTFPSAHMPVNNGVSGLFNQPSTGIMPPAGPVSAPMGSSASLPNNAQVQGTFDTSLWGAHSRTVSSNSEYEYGHHGLHSAPGSVLSSPITPSKRKHFPPVGKRLKPGPKPKNTPKKLKVGNNTLPPSSPPSGAAFASSSTLEEEGTHIPSSQVTSPEMTYTSQPSGLTVGISAATSKAKLELGGPLSATSSTFTFTAPVPGPSSQPSAVAEAQAMAAQGSYQGQFQVSSQGSSHQDNQPTLRMMPSNRQNTPEGIQIPGLPKEFIDKLYDTVYEVNPANPGGPPTKKFKCLIDECGRAFPRKSAISSHIQTHLDDKPHACDVDGCSAAFVRQHDLKRHMKIHSGSKPFMCICTKTFARGDALQRHRQRNICAGGMPMQQPHASIPFQMGYAHMGPM